MAKETAETLWRAIAIGCMTLFAGAIAWNFFTLQSMQVALATVTANQINVIHDVRETDEMLRQHMQRGPLP